MSTSERTILPAQGKPPEENSDACPAQAPCENLSQSGNSPANGHFYAVLAGYAVVFSLMFMWATLSTSMPLRQALLLVYLPALLSVFCLFQSFAWSIQQHTQASSVKLTAMIMTGCAPFVSWEFGYLGEHDFSCYFSLSCLVWETAFLGHLFALTRQFSRTAFKQKLSSVLTVVQHLENWLKFLLFAPAIALFLAVLFINWQPEFLKCLKAIIIDYENYLWSHALASLVHFLLLALTSMFFCAVQFLYFFSSSNQEKTEATCLN